VKKLIVKRRIVLELKFYNLHQKINNIYSEKIKENDRSSRLPDNYLEEKNRKKK